MSEETKEEIVKFDPNKMADQLKDKIRLELSELMPEETWKALIEAEVKKFVEPQTKRIHDGMQGWKTVPAPSVLGDLVSEVMTGEAKKLLSQKLTNSEWFQWDTVSAKLDELIAENVETVVQVALGKAMQQTINDMLQQVSQQMSTRF